VNIRYAKQLEKLITPELCNFIANTKTLNTFSFSVCDIELKCSWEQFCKSLANNKTITSLRIDCTPFRTQISFKFGESRKDSIHFRMIDIDQATNMLFEALEKLESLKKLEIVIPYNPLTR
jgi:hypothetical protein